jgi:osmotically-inducible protein OsmY
MRTIRGLSSCLSALRQNAGAHWVRRLLRQTIEEFDMAKRYEDRYGRDSYPERDRAEDRGYVDRASDEVRSWVGDEEAERRRQMDEQRDRERDARYRMESPRGDWHRSDYRPSDWQRRSDEGPDTRRRSPREDRARFEDWSRTWDAADWDRERSMRARNWWTRDDEANARARMSGAGRQTWSVDDGRMEFGDPRSRPAGNATRDAQRWGRGPKGYQRSDSRIHEEVCDRLTFSDVDAENIEVAVANGEVTLSGTVRDRWDKRLAEDLAEEVPGVRDVHNTIRVHRPERGIGQSDQSASDQPGTVLGVNPTSEPEPANEPRRRS